MSRVLVVDDEPAIGWSLRELLADEGHAVDVAATVAEALAAAARDRPDAILLDVRLPGRDGIDAIPDLREMAAARPSLSSAPSNLTGAVSPAAPSPSLSNAPAGVMPLLASSNAHDAASTCAAAAP